MVSGMAKTGIVGGVGIVVVVLSATLGWILVPDVLEKNAILTSDNEAVFEAWTIPPVPITMQFFLFNCTNCDNPRDNSVVLNLDQLGPFTFSEGRIKFGPNDGDVLEQNDRLTYRENITYYYSPEPGEMSMDLEMVSVNPVYFTLASLIADFVPEANATKVSTLMHNLLKSIDEGPFMKRKIREMLLEGYSLKPYIELLQQLAANNNITIPPLPVPEDPRFGYFYGMNGSNLGEFTIESGASGLDQLGVIRDWDGHGQQLEYWDDQYCDMINGTDGAIYPPLIKTDQRIYIFTPDLCRAVYATYERDVDILGVTSNRFTIPVEVFGAPIDTPENRCYCRYSKEDLNRCFGAGILDMRPCQSGAPILLSTPHFYLGDEKYVKAFTGLGPRKEWHETHFDLEPLSGIPAFASKRIQINIDVQKYYLPRTAFNLNNTVFPVVWINETAILDQKSADDVKKLLNVVDGLNISRWCFLAAGIVLVIAGIVMLAVFFPR